MWACGGARRTVLEIDERKFVDNGQLGQELLDLKDDVSSSFWRPGGCAAFAYLDSDYPFSRLVMTGPDPYDIARKVGPIVSKHAIARGARLIADEGGEFEKIDTLN